MTQPWWHPALSTWPRYVLQGLEDISAQHSLLIKKSETKSMLMNRPESNSSQIQEVNVIEVVNRFTNISSIVENSRGCEPEIHQRAKIARYSMTHHREIWTNSTIKTMHSAQNSASKHFGIFCLSLCISDLVSSWGRQEKNRCAGNVVLVMNVSCVLDGKEDRPLNSKRCQGTEETVSCCMY